MALTKEEITYLFTQGFTISEIRELDKPEQTLKKEPEESVEVVEKPEVLKAVEKPEPIKEPEKKNSDSSELESLRKEVEKLTKLVQTNNRKEVEIEPPKPEDVDSILASILENP